MAIWNRQKNNNELFKQITELKLSDFQRGIKPNLQYRNSSGSLIDIFQKEEMNPRRLKKLNDIYENEIIIEYLNDVEVKNKSNLRRSGFTMIEDHVKKYSEEELKQILNKFFSKHEIDENENYVLMGILQKYAELLDTYKYSNLTKYYDYIKKEIKAGVFEDIVVKGKQYPNNVRKKMAKLSEKWDRDTFEKYHNLKLLEKRLWTLRPDKCRDDCISIVNEILKMSYDEVLTCADAIKKEIQDIYLYYEAENRKDIISKIYNPEKNDEVIIDDLSKADGGLLLHFFGPYNRIFTYEQYINNLEEKLGRKLTEEEKLAERKKYEVMCNHYIPNKSVPMIAIGQMNEFYKYSVDVHNQLSTMVISVQDIFNMKGIRGNLALGFSKETLQPDQIATISNKNIHSNKDIESVETVNEFKTFSSNYYELINKDENEKNTELVLFRNSQSATLRPSYVLYISYENINSIHERKNIDIYKEQMKYAGLNVPFVIFDTQTIKKNLEKDKER